MKMGYCISRSFAGVLMYSEFVCMRVCVCVCERERQRNICLPNVVIFAMT